MHLCVCLCMRPLIFQCHTQNSRSLRANTADCVTVLLDVPNRLSQMHFDMPYTAGLSRAGVFPSRQYGDISLQVPVRYYYYYVHVLHIHILND